MAIGVDTGFFFALEELHPTAVEIWEKEEIITCSIVFVRITEKVAKGRIEQLDLNNR